MRLALAKRTGDAIRMLMHLAELPEGERLTSSQLAEATGVSRGNVPTLVAALSRAGLLDCARGPGGGCALSRRPSAITITDAVVAIEGSMEPEHCAVDESRCADRDYPCGIHDAWRAMISDLQEHLNQMTLSDAVSIQAANRRRHETGR